MELYKIDWSKYLSTERFRPPTGGGEKNESESHYDKRNPFESDFGRAVFSSACRRMHDKTQVMPLSTDDNVHSRLTHSLEVMSIAQSLGDNICRDKRFVNNYKANSFDLEREISAILRTAAIMHDIGNPPFGHFGEHTISKYFEDFFIQKGVIEIKEVREGDKTKKEVVFNEGNSFDLNEHQILDFINYDGNAQGLRVITKLQYLNDLAGLNLTYATLGAYLKYPNTNAEKNSDYIGEKKHGIYFTEKDIFNKIVDNCNLIAQSQSGMKRIKRHPLSFLVEAADTICYRSMDIEDGWNQGWYDFKDIIDWINLEIRKITNNEELDICKIIGYTGFEKDLPYRKKMVDFRVFLIQYFVNLATKNYIENLSSIEAGTYSNELLDDDPFRVEEALKLFTQKHIFKNREILSAELTGASVLKGLLDILIKLYFDTDKLNRFHITGLTSKTIIRTAVHEELNKTMKNSLELNCFDIKELNSYYKLRIIVDFVSGMTDQYAVKLYQKLSGQKL